MQAFSSPASFPPSRRLLLALTIAVVLVAAGCGSTIEDEVEPEAQAADAGDSSSGQTDEAAADQEPAEDSADSEDEPVDDSTELFPDVLAATATAEGGGSWTFSATLSSPYDSAERYADAWRVVGPDGEVFGIRELTHDHASEQPFTRGQSGIVIPEDVDTVIVEGRDQVGGWGGATVEVLLPD